MALSTENPRSPFLDVGSFPSEELEAAREQEGHLSLYEVDTPFQSIYELEGQKDLVDPEAEEFASFLADLHDPEFNDAIFELANEAADLYETRFEGEYGGRATQTYGS